MPSLVEPVLRARTLAAGPQPRLTGAAVALRPWSATDVPDLVEAYADPDIQRWHCRSLDDVEAAALIGRWHDDWSTETGASWAVVAPGGGRLLGRAGLRTMDLDGALAELAYWVVPAERGHGVAAAAVTTLGRWAFQDVGFQRLEIMHSTENAGSCAVAAATGYVLEGTRRASALHADGWHDMHLHGRLRTDPRTVPFP